MSALCVLPVLVAILVLLPCVCHTAFFRTKYEQMADEQLLKENRRAKRAAKKYLVMALAVFLPFVLYVFFVARELGLLQSVGIVLAVASLTLVRFYWNIRRISEKQIQSRGLDQRPA